MKKSKFKSLSFIICILYVFLLVPVLKPQIVHAETTSDGFTYTISGSTAAITGYTGPGGDITIPSTVSNGVFDYTVTSIGDNAFWNGYNLTGVTISSSITSIGNGAFFCCYSLKNVTIPSSVTSIGNRAFYGCNSFTSINIPNSVISIGDSAFESCWRVTSVTIPNSVTSIGDSAFFSCFFLPSVTIPNSVSSIGSLAFGGCDRLTSIDVDPSNGYYSSIDGVLFNKSASAIIECPGGIPVASYIIPNSVTSIGKDAFYDCNSLSGVTIPNGVTSIGDSAFYHMSNLTNITIPNSVTSIGWRSISACGNLKSIDVDPSNGYYSSINGVLFNKSADLIIAYPAGNSDTSYIIPGSVRSIGSYAFESSWILTNVTIPNSVTEIRDNAFNHCYNLTSAAIPGSVTSIGDSVFYDCGGLTSVTIGSGIKNISSGMFEFCAKLTSVIISNSVTSIGDSAFNSCTSLTSITIPDSVTYIGTGAFYNCSKLTQVQFLGDAPTLGFIVFDQCPSNLVLYYLCGKTGFTDPWYGYKTSKIGIEVTNPPLKTNYVVGDNLDTNGLVVTGYYYGGTTGIISNSLINISGFNSSVPVKNQVITVKVNENISTFTVNIFAKSYTVSFNSNGGSAAAAQSVNYNGKALKPKDPTLAGYTFDGWYTDQGTFANLFDFANTAITENITLYAKWTIKTVTGVSLDKTTASLSIGESTTLTATVNPTDTLNKNVTWSSSNTSVATVDNAGKVIAAAAGDATITVTTADGGFKAKCAVHVVKPGLTAVRYSGSNRFDTAVQVSKAGWSASQNVVLANAYGFADALTGVPFAYIKDAPILLTETASIPSVTMNEINRLRAKNIYILGGTGVISKNIENGLKSKGYNVYRLAGVNRFGTALQIGSEVLKNNPSKTAVLTTAYNYPDALAISSYAAISKYPVLYTEVNALNSDTLQFIKNNGITNIIIPGGTGAVSDNVVNQLKSSGINVQRITGLDRHMTALNIVTQFKGSFKNQIMISTGNDFPDALAGGVLAAKKQIPILLVDKNSVKDEVKNYIKTNCYGNMYILGGTGVITDSLVSTIIN